MLLSTASSNDYVALTAFIGAAVTDILFGPCRSNAFNSMYCTFNGVDVEKTALDQRSDGHLLFQSFKIIHFAAASAGRPECEIDINI